MSTSIYLFAYILTIKWTWSPWLNICDSIGLWNWNKTGRGQWTTKTWICIHQCFKLDTNIIYFSSTVVSIFKLKLLLWNIFIIFFQFCIQYSIFISINLSFKQPSVNILSESGFLSVHGWTIRRYSFQVIRRWCYLSVSLNGLAVNVFRSSVPSVVPSLDVFAFAFLVRMFGLHYFHAFVFLVCIRNFFLCLISNFFLFAVGLHMF